MQECYKLQINNRFFRLLVVVFLFNITTQALAVGGNRKADIKYSSPQVVIAVDLNRDGKIDRDIKQKDLSPDAQGKMPLPNDATTPTLPYRFWVNNDLDVVNYRGVIKWDDRNCDKYNTYDEVEYQQQCEQWDEDPVDAGRTNTSSTQLHKIESYRDLEDFAPLLMYIAKGSNLDEYTIKLKAVGVSVNLFKSNWSDTDAHVAHEYIFETQKTIAQVQLANVLQSASNPKGHFATVRAGAEGIEITQQIIDDYFDPDTGEARFIFEAITPSVACSTNAENCYLELELSKNDDETFEKDISRVYMDIHDIKDYYQHITAGTAQPAGHGDDFETSNDKINTSISTVRGEKIDIYTGLYAQPEIDKDLIVQMHGWRMLDAEKINFAETSYKRLYWSGYKGQFTTLSWPTGWHTKPAHKYGALQVPYLFGHEQNYDNSEAVARNVAPKLAEWLKSHSHGTGHHNPHTNLHVIAHSMGNVVVSEALMTLSGNIITSYTASQAATSSGAYDSNAADVAHELVALKLCDIDTGTNVGAEQGWRCYNKWNDLLEASTKFDMPPDMWRDDLIKRNIDGVPVDLDNNLIANGGNYIIEHGATGDANMGSNNQGKHYYAGIGLKTRILNFFNPGDAALTGWEFNQLTKPDYKGGPTWDYTNTYQQEFDIYEQEYYACLDYNQGEEFPGPEEICDADVSVQSLKPDDMLKYQSIFQLSGNSIPYNDATKIDILSHIIPARTQPLGQDIVELKKLGNTPVEIEDNPKMAGLTNSNQDHSAPFHGYYSQISIKPDARIAQRAAYWNTVLSRSLNLVGSDLTGLKNNITNPN